MFLFPEQSLQALSFWLVCLLCGFYSRKYDNLFSFLWCSVSSSLCLSITVTLLSHEPRKHHTATVSKYITTKFQKHYAFKTIYTFGLNQILELKLHVPAPGSNDFSTSHSSYTFLSESKCTTTDPTPKIPVFYYCTVYLVQRTNTRKPCHSSTLVSDVGKLTEFLLSWRRHGLVLQHLCSLRQKSPAI